MNLYKKIFQQKNQHIFLMCILFALSNFASAQSSASYVDIKNGVNIQASYYNGGHVNIGWDLMKTIPEIKALRIEIEPEYAFQARAWIREAHENGYQVIATYHDARKLGSDDRSELIKAANWWKTHYAALSSTGPIIINLMNEWGSHEITEEEYADAYNEAISIIRTFHGGKLIIDVPGWGQATRIAADAYQYLEDKDIIYSVHIYTSAFNIEQKRWLNLADLSYLDATGAQCIVGEFCDTPTGGANWCSIIDHCFQNGWPIFGWAWNGDGRGMNMVEPHWRDEPLADSFRPTPFMKTIVDKLRGIECFTQADINCNSNSIGDRCDDGNPYTTNDRYNEHCHCTGTFTEAFISNDTESDMILYPNPITINQELTIELFQVNKGGYLSIIDNMGANRYTRKLNAIDDKIIIDTQLLTPGLYWSVFKDQDGLTITKAFVVY